VWTHSDLHYLTMLYNRRMAKMARDSILFTGGLGIGSTGGSGGGAIVGLTVISSGSPGNYTPANSGIFIKNLSGTELMRIWASDPNSGDYGSASLFIWCQSGFSQTTDNVSAGYANTAVGSNSLWSNTTGAGNSAFGYQSQFSNVSGSENVSCGDSSLYYNVNGINNTACGTSALIVATGDYSTACGSYALIGLTTGSNNTAVGYRAGQTLATGSNCTFLGNSADTMLVSASNSTAVGNGATITASNQMVFGNSSVTQVVINGWIQNTNGAAALAANFTNNTATLAAHNTNLSFTVLAGRSYRIKGYLQVSNSTAAEGIQFDFGGGSVTATTFFVTGQAIGSVTAGTVVSTSLTGPISYSVVTGTDYIEVNGYLKVNAGGTVIIRFAENTTAVGTATLGAGSWIELTDTGTL
jgi:hypothetical protein